MKKKVSLVLLAVCLSTNLLIGCNKASSSKANETVKVNETQNAGQTTGELQKILDNAEKLQKSHIKVSMKLDKKFNYIESSNSDVIVDNKVDASQIILKTEGQNAKEQKIYKYHDNVLLFNNKLNKYVDITKASVLKDNKPLIISSERIFRDRTEKMVSDLITTLKEGDIKKEKVDKKINNTSLSLNQYSAKVLKDKSKDILKEYIQYAIDSNKDALKIYEYNKQEAEKESSLKRKLNDLEKRELEDKVNESIDKDVKDSMDKAQFGDVNFVVTADSDKVLRTLDLQYDILFKGQNIKFQYSIVVEEYGDSVKVPEINKADIVDFQSVKDKL